MAKLIKKFGFEIPVTVKSNINGQLKQTCIGNIEVDAVATLYFNDEPDIDYNSIKWNGVDIFPLIDNFPAADEMMQQIHETAHNHILNNFSVEALSEDKGIAKLEEQRQEVNDAV